MILEACAEPDGTRAAPPNSSRCPVHILLYRMEKFALPRRQLENAAGNSMYRLENSRHFAGE